MKKILSLLIAIMMIFSLASCGFMGEIPYDSTEPTDTLQGESGGNGGGGGTQGGNTDTSKNYEFQGIGLGEDQEGVLLTYFADCKPGAYSLFGEIYAYKCKNGDLIQLSDDGDHTIFTLDDYKYYDLHKESGAKSCYDLWSFKDNKKEFYYNFAIYSNIFGMTKCDESKTYANAGEFIAEQGITLQGAGKSDTVPETYELLNYREYSPMVDKNFLVTSYMNSKSQDFEYLREFAEKVLYWEVRYINSPAVYVEKDVYIQFTASFDHNDYEKVRNILIGKGMVSAYDYDFMPVQPNSLNQMEGKIATFVMPFKDEGEIWYDYYKMVGFSDSESDMSVPYFLDVEYLYEYWYDGGSNATYVRRADGLWRFINDHGWLMIGPDGTVYKYDPETGVIE